MELFWLWFLVVVFIIFISFANGEMKQKRNKIKKKKYVAQNIYYNLNWKVPSKHEHRCVPDIQKLLTKFASANIFEVEKSGSEDKKWEKWLNADVCYVIFIRNLKWKKMCIDKKSFTIDRRK